MVPNSWVVFFSVPSWIWMTSELPFRLLQTLRESKSQSRREMNRKSMLTQEYKTINRNILETQQELITARVGLSAQLVAPSGALFCLLQQWHSPKPSSTSAPQLIFHVCVWPLLIPRIIDYRWGQRGGSHTPWLHAVQYVFQVEPWTFTHLHLYPVWNVIYLISLFLLCELAKPV